MRILLLPRSDAAEPARPQHLREPRGCRCHSLPRARRSQRSARRMSARLGGALAALAALLALAGAAMDECAEERSGRAQRCMPEFVNAAFNRSVVATNTCGSPAEEYCVQTGVTGVTKSCHLCDASQPHLRHGAAFLTDYNNQADTTWWQSQTMLAGVQYPSTINLTLHLGECGPLPSRPLPLPSEQAEGVRPTCSSVLCLGR